MTKPLLWLGIALGWLSAGVHGALLGGLLGHLAGRRWNILQGSQLLDLLLYGQVLGNTQRMFLLLGRLAKCDGRVLAVHIQQARWEMRALNLDVAAQKQAIAAFGRGKDGRLWTRWLLRPLRRQPAQAERLLRACWRMAWADGYASTDERQLILRWANLLGWSVDALRALGVEYAPKRSQVVSQTSAYQQALRLLGVSASSDPAQIKYAYRRLVSRYHPDRLQGASAAQLKAATDKTSELHAAYALIRRQHGFH